MQGRVVTEGLARVIDLALIALKFFVNLSELLLKLLHVLADSRELILNIPEVFAMSSVVTSHALEAPRENAFLACNPLKRFRCFILESLKLAAYLWQGIFNVLSVLLRLLKMAAPLLAICNIWVNLKLVSNLLDLDLPLLLADVALDDRILLHLSLHLLGKLCLDVTASHIEFLINIVARILRVDHISEVCASVHLVDVFRIFISPGTFILDRSLFKFEFVFQRDLGELEQYVTDLFTAASLELVWRDLQIQAQVLQLLENVLRGSHWVIVFVPPLDLVVVY